MIPSPLARLAFLIVYLLPWGCAIMTVIYKPQRAEWKRGENGGLVRNS